jgi:hypothetical protein
MSLRRHSRSAVALCAAYAFAIQAVLSAFLLIAHAGEGASPFAQICEHGQSAPGGIPADRAPCCACPACSASGEPVALPPMPAAIALVRTAERAAPPPAEKAVEGPKRARHNPRAPPALA